MVEILKFIQPETAFDPEAIRVLASALDEAWGRVTVAMREVIAKRIIEMAQRGVKDQQTLVDDAVRFLAANYKGLGKRPA